MGLDSAKEIWDFLKKEYQGNERIRGMKVLNLIREFEVMKMNEQDSMRDYADKLLDLVNNIRLLGHEFADLRIVEKLLVTAPERYEATITTLENTKDLSKVSLVELLNAFQAQEQRRLIRQESSVEGALYSTSKYSKKKKGKNTEANEYATTQGSNSNQAPSKSYPPCQNCGKYGHPHYKCWSRPDAKCSNCNQMGHEARICKNLCFQQEEKAKSVEKDDEEELFAATWLNSKEASKEWLVDSGCTNHMAHDKELFRNLHKTSITKVTIGNGDLISVEGKGSISLETFQGTKIIHDVLYVPHITKNLLSVGQFLEKGYKVVFEDNLCIIKERSDVDLLKVKMKGKSFSFYPKKKEHSTQEEASESEIGGDGSKFQESMNVSMFNVEVPDLKLELASCEVIQQDKQTQHQIPKVAKERPKEKELVDSILHVCHARLKSFICMFYYFITMLIMRFMKYEYYDVKVSKKMEKNQEEEENKITNFKLKEGQNYFFKKLLPKDILKYFKS